MSPASSSYHLFHLQLSLLARGLPHSSRRVRICLPARDIVTAIRLPGVRRFNAIKAVRPKGNLTLPNCMNPTLIP
jgi:hypothetical protein